MLFFGFILYSVSAIACTGDKWIDAMIERSALALIFTPNGQLSSVKCDTTRYTKLQCASAGEYVFDYYANKKKG